MGDERRGQVWNRTGRVIRPGTADGEWSIQKAQESVFWLSDQLAAIQPGWVRIKQRGEYFR